MTLKTLASLYRSKTFVSISLAIVIIVTILTVGIVVKSPYDLLSKSEQTINWINKTESASTLQTITFNKSGSTSSDKIVLSEEVNGSGSMTTTVYDGSGSGYETTKTRSDDGSRSSIETITTDYGSGDNGSGDTDKKSDSLSFFYSESIELNKNEDEENEISREDLINIK
jgi:hypothetical protein